MNLQSDVQAALDRSINAERLAGALALVWHEGETVVTAASGFRDVARNIPMAPDAIFQIASMTKPIVSVAALQLLDEGRLRLSDPIARWLPEFAAPRVLDDPAGSLADSRPALRPITVGDLLTHRAGLGYAFASRGPIAQALERSLGNVLHSTLDPGEWLEALARLPLLSGPGERFIYGHAHEVLGCLLARIDGGTLGDSLNRRVLEPLGMTDTAFYVPAAKLPRLAHIYSRAASGFVDLTDAPISPPLFEAGGGGLYSTAADYLRFARALIGGGEADGLRILSPETAALLTSNQLTPQQRRLEALGRADFFAHTGYGLGVAVEMEPAPPLYLAPGALSWGGIFGTGWRADPTNRLITLFLSQSFADTTAGPNRRDPAELTPAATLQAEFEQIARAALVHRPEPADGWVRLASRHRNSSRTAGR